MLKKVIFCCAAIIFSIACKAQQPANPINAKHDWFNSFYQDCEDVVLPAYVESELKQYAFIKHIDEQIALKQTVVLRVLYNERFSVQDRLLLAAHLEKRYGGPNSPVPLTLILKEKQKLELSLKAGK